MKSIQKILYPFYVTNVITKLIHKSIYQNMSKWCMKEKKISNVKIVNLKLYMKVRNPWRFEFQLPHSNLMCGSCHFKRVTNDKFSVEFWMYVLIFFQPTSKADMKVVQITLIRVTYSKETILIPWRCPKLQNSAVVQKNTITNIWHSTPVSTFVALSKWQHWPLIKN